MGVSWDLTLNIMDTGDWRTTDMVETRFFQAGGPEDRTEDWDHENGKYFCKCSQCEIGFVGHKRRTICKTCDTKFQDLIDSMTDEERVAFDEKRNKEIAEAFAKYSLDNFKTKVKGIEEAYTEKRRTAIRKVTEKMSKEHWSVTRPMLVKECLELGGHKYIINPNYNRNMAGDYSYTCEYCKKTANKNSEGEFY